MSASLPARLTLEMSTVPAFRTEPLLMNVPWKLVVPPLKRRIFPLFTSVPEDLSSPVHGD